MPAENARETAIVNNLEVYGAHTLKEVADILNGTGSIEQTFVDTHAIQTERVRSDSGVHCNAQMGSKLTREHCQLTDECRSIMEMAMNHPGLSARAYDRILRVSRTIADLEASPSINPDHLREAITYRSLDRDSWGW